MIRSIIHFLPYLLFRIRFKLNNKHNMVKPTKQFPLNSVHVGKGTYGDLNVIWIAPNSTRLRIGNYVSIGPKVEFLVGGEHNYHRISTYPFQSFIYKQETKAHINRDIIVEDDVWIGYNSLIMSGVRIGKGSVIGCKINCY